MKTEIIILENNDADLWDKYVKSNPNASVYHLFDWKQVLENVYGKKTFYLAAIEKTGNSPSSRQTNHRSEQASGENRPKKIVGVLPLVLLKDPVFENALISMPFFDYGGVLADNTHIFLALISRALEIGKRLRISHLELRQTHESSRFLLEHMEASATGPVNTSNVLTRTHKVRMLLPLVDSSEKMMEAFKSKLRSQIRKPIKEGLHTRVGKEEMLDDFFSVFSTNMRDLGSPVHSKRLFREIFRFFPEKAQIVTAYKGERAMASGIMLCFQKMLYNPWSASLREFNRLCPNMLLYWTKIAFGCDNGYEYLDLGRSTPEEGTYRFKKQWGTKQENLYWHYIGIDKKPRVTPASESTGLSLAANVWKKLPLSVTRMLGPLIRQNIGL